ncbi:MAG: hypothetical protein OK454_11695, partial [Thaumarchaeota archaeon]|nr:hypothetical protein [Nitrososphaerota archaeon]
MVVRFGGRRKRADKKRRTAQPSAGNSSVEPETDAEESLEWDDVDDSVRVIGFESTPEVGDEVKRDLETDQVEEPFALHTDSDGPYDLLMESNHFAAEEREASSVLVDVHQVYALRDNLQEVYAALDNLGEVHEDNHQDNHHLYASGEDAHAVYDPDETRHDAYVAPHGTYTARDDAHDVVVQEEEVVVV